tara:strand:- start:622 stop:1089 length:468 start_codon:yes stop_codon:yes gene_type:complete
MYFFTILFLMAPFAEILLLISVGSYFGALNTIGLVLATAVIGGIIIRVQGTEILWLVKRKLTQGQLPAEELFSGLMLIISGILLCAPGFCTDSMGFLLLVPKIRYKFSQGIKKRIFADFSCWSGKKKDGARSIYEPGASGTNVAGEIENLEDAQN